MMLIFHMFIVYNPAKQNAPNLIPTILFLLFKLVHFALDVVLLTLLI